MTTLQKLIYGERNLFISTVSTENTNQDNNIEVVKFLIHLNELGYSISNVEDLFLLSKDNFNKFSEELFKMFNDLEVKGFIFRKGFADSIEQKSYSQEDWLAMFAQYSLTYGSVQFYTYYYEVSPEDYLKNYVGDIKKISKIHTDNREFEVNFSFDKTVSSLVKSIMETNIVLREQQIQILKNTPIDILEKVYNEATFTIKETEVLIVSILLEVLDPVKLFKDPTQIVRIIASNFLYNMTVDGDIEKVSYLGQITNSFLKKKIIKIPTKIKKAIIKSLDNQKNIDYTIEQMFKNYGFWKKILTAARFTSQSKINKNYPTFSKIKDLLYKNDRSNTFNGKVENFKKAGDYNSALKVLSTNPGYMLRNILEYLRYTNGTNIAKKLRLDSDKKKNVLDTNYYEREPVSLTLGDIIRDKLVSEEEAVIKDKNSIVKKELVQKDDIRVQKVITDASEFLNSSEFVEVLLKTNTKLLWQMLSLLKDENLYEDRTQRIVQGTEIKYTIPLPAVKRIMAKSLERQIKRAIKKIKKVENINLGKVFIDKSLKNYNVQFSGRGSTEIVLSGEFLTPGSKIPFSDLTGADKILRLGVAWKGKDSCDIDHSLNLLDKNISVYYGNPTFKFNEEIIISSSGDITSNNNTDYSVEFIDIDIDKAKTANIGNMVSSLIQFSGDNLNEYEVLWFMNIIDKDDRIIGDRAINIAVDQMQYAIQITEETKSMLGFYINFDKDELEVLNIPTKSHNMANAVVMEKLFQEALDNRPPVINMYKAVKNVIKHSQIVDTIEEANIVISSNEVDFDGELIHPGRNGERLNSIIF